jgi:hypothetical protein
MICPSASAVSSIGTSKIHLYYKFQSRHVCRGKPRDINKTAGLPAKIWTRCLPDTSQVYHRSIFITIITIMECLLQWYLSFITFISWVSLHRNLFLWAPRFCRLQASYLVIRATLLNDIRQPASHIHQYLSVSPCLVVELTCTSKCFMWSPASSSYLTDMNTCCSKFDEYCQ